MNSFRWMTISILVLLTGFGGTLSSPTQQDTAPRILAMDTQNQYPNALTFTLTAESDVPIQKITLFYQLSGSISNTRQKIDFTPATHVSVEYTWDTSGITVPPSSPIIYSWEIKDENGKVTRSPDQSVRYDDTRFDWQELSSDELVVRWYQGDAAFGEFVFQTAQQALAQMESQSGRGLENPVYVLMYPNKADFASWHTFVDDWVGGQAFPAMGVTVEIISPNDAHSWIQDVIPHEIAHLFFYQAIHAGIADWPHWMDEGIAQYYEFGDQSQTLAMASAAAKGGTLISLEALNGSFGRDRDQVNLSYAESLSAVTYMVETWGSDGLSALVSAFRDGASTREAFQTAYHVTWEEFIAGWLTWMGVPATPVPMATPTAGLVYPTAPSGWPTVTPHPSETPLPPATPTHTPAKTTPVSTQEDTPKNFPNCAGGAVLGLLPLFGLVALTTRKRTT